MSNERPKSRVRFALVLALATIYLVWGSTYLGIRVAVESFPPFAMAGSRFLIAGAVLYSFLLLRGHSSPTRKQWRDNSLIGIFLLLGGNGLVCWAEVTVHSGIAALFVSAGPVFTVLLEWLWPGGERPTALTFAGLACGIAGVTWLAAPWEQADQQLVAAAGAFALLGACASWSVGAIFTRRSQHQPPALMAAAMQMLSGGVALTLVAGMRGELSGLHLVNFTEKSVFAFSYLVVVGSLIGFSTFAWLMKNTSPAIASTYAYVNPVVAVLLGWLLLNEPVSPHLGLAAVFIVSSVILITLGRSRASKAARISSDEAKS
ncbi:MAG: drug/metabolite exporter YedA [Opitutaceae bacterium]|nr:drug/metabolite exporter YedA [Opitutaceae bacterium]